jgi:uncharacterized membrane protein (DUF485 family)
MVLEKQIADINHVKAPMGIILLILNIIIPGVGTFINGLMGDKIHLTTVIIGILQILTTFILIGWIWSIWWGILIFQKQKK